MANARRCALPRTDRHRGVLPRRAGRHLRHAAAPGEGRGQEDRPAHQLRGLPGALASWRARRCCTAHSHLASPKNAVPVAAHVPLQAVRNMDDLETMACPPKYRDIQTFYKYYSGEKVAPFPTLFSERFSRREAMGTHGTAATRGAPLRPPSSPLCPTPWMCALPCLCACARARVQSGATTRRQTTCGSSTTAAGRRPTSFSSASPAASSSPGSGSPGCRAFTNRCEHRAHVHVLTLQIQGAARAQPSAAPHVRRARATRGPAGRLPARALGAAAVR